MATVIPVTGASITLDEAGIGPPVLLLHGFPSTRKLWAGVAPALVEAGYRVLVPDLVGYGTCDAPAAVRVDMASQARWLLELLDALGVSRAAVVAHDVGSAAAQILLASAPDRVRGLAVLDGVYLGEWAMDAVAGIQAWNPADAHRLFPVLARRLGKTAVLRELFAAYEGKEGGLRLIRAARDLDPSQTADLGETLRNSGVPALVLWGEHDAVFPVESVARPLAELLHAKLVLLPGGHFTPADCPDEVAVALLVFLSQLVP